VSRADRSGLLGRSADRLGRSGRLGRLGRSGRLGRLGRLGRSAVRFRRPFRPVWLDAGWVVFSAVNVVAIFVFPMWATIPIHVIWICVTLVYGFRTWSPGPALWVIGVVMATTATDVGVDLARGAEPTEVPLMAAIFLAIVWHARRKLAAEKKSSLVSEENVRLLATQRRFLQDASHQLRTPITIALGHAELLARSLTGRQEGHDIQVVLDELSRLRRISERLLVIAAAEDPEFLYPEPVALDSFTMEILRRWRPTANRRWQLGRLDKVTTQADKERLGLAIDALLENAVRHTGDGDVIKLSVMAAGAGLPVRMVVSDAGQGIPDEQLKHIFDRFRSGDNSHPRGTGLGLALVRAVARAHGGEVLVRSRPGQGSEFELRLGLASLGFPAGAPAGMAAVGPTGMAAVGPAVGSAGMAGAGNGGKLARTPWRESFPEGAEARAERLRQVNAAE
jgi:signal transduction histidine kinase